MKGFVALAITALMFLLVADAHAQCGVRRGGGCGVNSGCGVQRVTTDVRFQGPSVVPAPAPVNEISVTTSKREDLEATVGAPTLACDGTVSNHCVRRPRAIRQAAVEVPTDRGYFYTERRTGLLGLRGRVIQYHEYGGGASR